MWGTQIESARRCAADRFTPTHVGNTQPLGWYPGLLAVHPHACGEHCSARLPPGRCIRFTPTHVGNTAVLHLWHFQIAVHPHACGEHRLRVQTAADNAGSPPRMWGTRLPVSRMLGGKRFTPTHVGNTCWSPESGQRQTVHPHACGEHALTRPSDGRQAGSPPRMWGTQPFYNKANGCWRFTPTHVGNTSSLRISYPYCSVHPHACGEHRIY